LIYLRFEHLERQHAIAQHQIMKVFELELLAQLFAGRTKPRKQKNLFTKSYWQTGFLEC